MRSCWSSNDWSKAAAELILVCVWAIAAPAAAQPRPLEGLDAFVTRAMGDWSVPGLALGIVKNDSVVFIRGYGVRSIESKAAVDEATVFAIGSAGKAFTTAALAILADAGRLGWDDRVIDRLPGFALSDSDLTRQITVRDLVTHRTGLPGGRANLLFFGGGYDRAEILRESGFSRLTRGFGRNSSIRI